MSSERRPWVVDTSVLVSYVRLRRHSEFVDRQIDRGAIFLPGVVLFELYAGAMTRAARAAVEDIRRAFGENLVDTAPDDWLLAGRCLVRYAQRWGSVRPRDHLADALVAVTAARLHATVVAEDVRGLMRWAWALERFGARVRVESLTA